MQTEKPKVTVTVNSRPVVEYVRQEISKEIQDFYRSELRGMGRVSRRQILSGPSTRNVSKVEQLGNGSIRCA